MKFHFQIQLLTVSHRISAMDTQADGPCSSTGDTSYVNIEDILMQIKEFTKYITGRIKENASVAQGMQTFLRRYKTLTQDSTMLGLLVRFIVLGGCLEVLSKAHKVVI